MPFSKEQIEEALECWSFGIDKLIGSNEILPLPSWTKPIVRHELIETELVEDQESNED